MKYHKKEKNKHLEKEKEVSTNKKSSERFPHGLDSAHNLGKSQGCIGMKVECLKSQRRAVSTT